MPHFFSLLYRIIRRLLMFAWRRPRTTLAVACAVFLASLSGLPRLKIVLGPDELVGGDFASARDMRDLETDFKTSPNVLIHFYPEGARAGQIVTSRDLDEIDRFLQTLQLTFPGVRRVLSPFSVRKSQFANDVLTYPKVVDPAEPASLRRLEGTLWSGVLTDPIGAERDFLAEIQFEPEFSTPNSARKLRAEWIARPGRPRDLQADFTGDLVYRQTMEESLAKVQAINLAVLLFLVFGFRFLFGTWRSGLLFAGTLIFTTIVMHGAMALLGSPIDTLSSTLFVMVTIASLEDFIFVSYARMRDEGSDRTYRHVFRKLVFPGFLTSLTTFIGFLSLVVSDLSVVRRFGAWAAFGSAIEWMAIFWFLPALMALFPKLRDWTNGARARGGAWLHGVGRVTPSKAFTLSALLVFVAAGVGVARIHVNDDPMAIFPKSHSFRTQLASLFASRGWVGEMNVVFPRFDREVLGRAELAFARNSNVARIVSPNRILAEMEGGEGIAPNDSLRELVQRDIRQGAFFSRYVTEDEKSRIVLYVKSMELEKVNRLLDDINRFCAPVGCRPAGSLVAYADFSDHVLETLVESLATSLVLVAVVLLGLGRWLGYGWKSILLPVTVSSLFGPAFVVFAQAATGLNLNFFTSVIAAVLVGISGDNAIQYLWAGRKKGMIAGIDERGVGSIQCSVLMATACLFNLASPFQPARTLALLFFIGLLASLFGDLTLLRGLLGLGRRGT